MKKAMATIIATLFLLSVVAFNVRTVQAVTIDIDPGTLNINSDGTWITAYIEPSVLFQDTFTRTDWTNQEYGVWTVETVDTRRVFEAKSDGVHRGTAIFAGDTSWTDYELEAKIWTDDTYWGLIYHADATGTSYYDAYLNTAEGKIEIWKHTDGMWTRSMLVKQIPVGGPSISANTWYKMKVMVVGNNIKVFFALEADTYTDTPQAEFTDTASPYLSGRIGLLFYDISGPSTYVGRFDDVIVTDLSGTILFEEHFDWQVILGEWKVLDYEYQQIANWYIPGARSFAEDTAWTNYVMITKVKITDDGWGGVLLRANAAGDTYYELYLQRGGRLQLVKTVAGVRVGIMNPYVGSFADQYWYIKAQVVGNVVRGKAWPCSDSEPATWLVEWTDSASPITSGRIGLITFSWWTTQLPVYFDDVLVTDIDVHDIDVSTVELYYTEKDAYIATAASEPATVGDYDSDGIPDLMVKFDRATVAGFLRDEEISSGTYVDLTIKGQVNGIDFDGTDSLRVISKGKLKV